jgi:hypothetical protein
MLNEKLRAQLNHLSKINDSLYIQYPTTGTQIDEIFQIFLDTSKYTEEFSPYAVYSFSELSGIIDIINEANITRSDNSIEISNDYLTAKFLLSPKKLIEYPSLEPELKNPEIKFNLSKEDLLKIKQSISVFRDEALKVKIQSEDNYIKLSVNDYVIQLPNSNETFSDINASIISDYVSLIPDTDYKVQVFEDTVKFESENGIKLYIQRKD